MPAILISCEVMFVSVMCVHCGVCVMRAECLFEVCVFEFLCNEFYVSQVCSLWIMCEVCGLHNVCLCEVCELWSVCGELCVSV